MLNAQGTALIQIEASLGKEKNYISTRIYVRPNEWDKKSSFIVNHPHADDLNAWLYEQIVKLEGLELTMWKRGITPTLSQMKTAVEGSSTSEITFRSFCTSVIRKSNRKKSTQYNLLGTLSLLSEFRSVYTWEDLNYTFLKEFEYWLRGRSYAVNTVAKHLRNFRTLINEAIAAGYLPLDANPFLKYSIKQEKTPHRFLKPEELELLEKMDLAGVLAHIRDVFLFCCYTGLRFSDFKQLRDSHLVEQHGKLGSSSRRRRRGIWCKYHCI